MVARLIIGALIVGSILIGAVGFYALSRPREAPGPPGASSGEPVWRVEGRITDTASNPIGDVCVAIGPNGCQRASPHSAGDGYWSFDFPQVAVSYTLHFTKQGYRDVDMRFILNGPRRVDVVMERRS